MGFQICYCGTQPGYPHPADCPYPLFTAVEKEEKKWQQAREKLRNPLIKVGPDQRFVSLDKQEIDDLLSALSFFENNHPKDGAAETHKSMKALSTKLWALLRGEAPESKGNQS